jgi:co-chaperonin GroES (HSP10)
MSEPTTNTSGVTPRGRAVLVRPYAVEERTAAGIILANETIKKDQLAEQRAIVISVGPEAWRQESEPRALPGDRVLFSKWAGYSLTGPADDQQYRVVNDSDIFMVITKEKSDGH